MQGLGASFKTQAPFALAFPLSIVVFKFQWTFSTFTGFSFNKSDSLQTLYCEHNSRFYCITVQNRKAVFKLIFFLKWNKLVILM